MFVKSLDIYGFKSFGDKTHIEFPPGMTAIVGPNGCGKSNVCDAFRWVLGEQRARALRGARMEDVIFNGTETRHALGMAEVTLTIDNSTGDIPVDYTEVMVTRRLFRSGDSEYLLNKVPCRLRDITELFMDTGLSKSAYSVIGQGKMDLVLSSKPEERRFLFEEAAGIVKYKTRQQAAMRRLTSAENNLLRLDDVITEVGRRMRSLRRQAGAARRYKEMQQSLRQLEVRTAYTSFEKLTRDCASVESRLVEQQQQREGHAAALAAAEADRETLAARLMESERELTAGRVRLHELETETDRLERLVSVLRERIGSNRQLQDRAESDLAAIDVRSAELKRESETFIERLRATEQQSNLFTEKLSEREAEGEKIRQNRTAVSERAERLHAKSAELTRRNAEISALRETLQNEINRLSTEKEELTKRLEQTATSVARANEDLIEARAAAQSAQSESVRAEQAVAEQEKHITELQTKLDGVTEVLDGLRDEHSRMVSRLESIEDLYQRFEGYLEGPRNLLIARRDKKEFASEVRGAVADIVNVSSEYESAVEAVLGESAQWIVTSTRPDARGCLDYLTSNDAGRATLVPLDGIDLIPVPSEIDQAVLNMPEVVGRIADLIECDPEYGDLIDRLVGNALLVESIDAALSVHDAYPGRLMPAMVTTDGTVIGPLGSISGGQTRSAGRGLVGRRAEMDELRRQIADLETRVAKTLDIRDGLQSEITAAREELTLRETDLRQTSVRAAEIVRDLAAKEETAARLADQERTERARAETIEQQKTEIVARRELADKQIAETETERKLLDTEIENVTREMRRLQESEEESRRKITEAQLEQAQIRHTVTSIRTEMARLRQLQEEIDERRAMRLRELEEARVAATKTAEEIHETEQKVAAAIAARDEAQKVLVEMENARHETLEAIESIDTQLKELRNTVQTVQAEVHGLELELTQKRDQLDNIQERIADEYDVWLKDLTLEDVGTDEFTDEERAAEIERIRDRLGRIGAVNLMAIEEETEHKERYEFLVAQREDLMKAKNTLMQIVDKFNRTTEEMFLQTFEQVQINFHELFRSLVGGGQAKLSLLDEENVLDSGIAISVRPPGKKMQSLELFSGGERAMIAIALLFAIFRCRPSPFCILDEVDAPLDDANIDRFMDMLAEFTHSTQFVVITHNKISMERADVMYGVTMAEQGVSQVISTRLADITSGEIDTINA